jgi:hypothetical protein
MNAQEPLQEFLARKRVLDSPETGAADFVARLRDLRVWQSARLARTYQDFREDARYLPAVEFFLSDLYGPQDFTDRNRDLERAWRYLKRALPQILMRVLENAIELEVLTLELDHAMVHALTTGPVTEITYAAAYRRVNNRTSRTRQIDLIVRIGEDLTRIVSRTWIGPLLHAGHIAAHAAGFGVLQNFLERGYSAFRQMGAAERLLKAVRERETHFMLAMFAANETPHGAALEQGHE